MTPEWMCEQGKAVQDFCISVGAKRVAGTSVLTIGIAAIAVTLSHGTERTLKGLYVLPEQKDHGVESNIHGSSIGASDVVALLVEDMADASWASRALYTAGCALVYATEVPGAAP